MRGTSVNSYVAQQPQLTPHHGAAVQLAGRRRKAAKERYRTTTPVTRLDMKMLKIEMTLKTPARISTTSIDRCSLAA